MRNRPSAPKIAPIASHSRFSGITTSYEFVGVISPQMGRLRRTPSPPRLYTSANWGRKMPVFPNFFPFSPRLRRSLVKIPEFSQSADISAHLRQKFIPVLYCTSLNSTLRIEQKAQALRAHLLISGQPPLMPRILSISYDKALLHTRELMLSREGFEVVSAVGFSAAVEACKQGLFDLVIMGHSIPSADKAAITTQLRAMCDTPILAL